jgi:hypothetical protein
VNLHNLPRIPALIAYLASLCLLLLINDFDGDRDSKNDSGSDSDGENASNSEADRVLTYVLHVTKLNHLFTLCACSYHSAVDVLEIVLVKVIVCSTTSCWNRA